MNRIPTLIDSHIHLDDPRFDPDRDALMARAHAAGLRGYVVPAITRQAWPRLRSCCANIATAEAAYGLHPCFLDQHDDEEDLAELASWIARESAVAIGECGLDRFIEQPQFERQQRLFDAQLALAREFDLPIIIHARRAVEEVIRMIRQAHHHKGVVHSFSGSAEQARQLLDLGYHLGFGGAASWPRAKRIRAVFASLPDDAILLETDAPDQPDVDHPEQRNEPSHLAAILVRLAEVRGCSPYALALKSRRNTRALFHLEF